MLKDSIKHLRKQKGWSQTQLAKKAGVSQQLIWKIEAGKARESRKLPKIAKAFGMTAEQLLEFDVLSGGTSEQAGSSIPLSDEEEKLVEAFRRSGDERRQAILDVAHGGGRRAPSKSRPAGAPKKRRTS